MQPSRPVHIAASIIIILGTACFVMFETPFIALVIFVALCLMWSAWCFISVFRGPDEVESAGVRYALAFASGIGLPLAIAFVLLMIATPAIQGAISFLAASARHGLDPASAGFAMGIGFTVLISSVTLCAGLVVWWAPKQ